MKRLAVLVLLLALAACAPTVQHAGAPGAGFEGPRLEDHAVVSFDGTPIVYNLMEPPDASASHRVPTILRAHGWGAAGETPSFLSSASRALLAADYAVLSWDARGFGQSGGLADVDGSPSLKFFRSRSCLSISAISPCSLSSCLRTDATYCAFAGLEDV